MEITLLQGLLITLVVFLVAWDARWECFFVFRPIVISFFIGIILGDVKLGLSTGALTELAYLGLTTVGGTVPPNPLMAGLMTTVLAYINGISAKEALGLSLPFALLMQLILIITQSLFSLLNVKLEKAAQERNFKKFSRIIFTPVVIESLLYAIVTFLSVFALQGVIAKFVNSLPWFINGGFEIAGGLLPGVGLALLLKVMVRKDNVAFLAIGFIMMSVLSLKNILPIAICGAAVAYLIFMNDKKVEKLKLANEGGKQDEDGI
ncbi:PTS sugar transporter subunit IIC [Caproiciproducens sp.]|uniref:PTS sugar transporter subunit IIC n=1 Tax=Caproiciproducens sp. TaxID=1954376 RepID=UPI00289D0E47|nr:PTS sugar transporter subunit IIC [Caproiciproducens sp.]